MHAPTEDQQVAPFALGRSGASGRTTMHCRGAPPQRNTSARAPVEAGTVCACFGSIDGRGGKRSGPLVSCNRYVLKANEVPGPTCASTPGDSLPWSRVCFCLPHLHHQRRRQLRIGLGTFAVESLCGASGSRAATASRIISLPLLRTLQGCNRQQLSAAADRGSGRPVGRTLFRRRISHRGSSAKLIKTVSYPASTSTIARLSL